MSTTSTPLMTADELIRLPRDQFRYELINGELKKMPPPGFPHGLADVQELIKVRKLDAEFGQKLDPYVRTKYLELEEAVRKSESSQEK